MKKFLCLVVVGMMLSICLGMADTEDLSNKFIVGDLVPQAPELAKRGAYSVGVKTLTFVNKNQLDVVHITADNPNPIYDRKLTVEVWYPANLREGEKEITKYVVDFKRDANSKVYPLEILGRAVRDAAPLKEKTPYPLVIMSHGYTGSRYIMSYLAENLASKGYVVVSIDHTDSTYSDVGPFSSTLINRSLDQIFVIDSLEKLVKEDTFWKDLYDPNNVGLIGYSMGGYGALRTIGAGYSAILLRFTNGVGDFVLEEKTLKGDPRVKACVLFAPWGGDFGFWTKTALAKITTPTFWVAGTLDDVAGFNSITKLFESAVNSPRYFLIYENARHNIAPNPPFEEAKTADDYLRWGEPIWNEKMINNINQHFVTAFLGIYLKKDTSLEKYVNVKVEEASEGVYALDSNGNPKPEHTYWPGFAPRTAIGLKLLKRF